MRRSFLSAAFVAACMATALAAEKAAPVLLANADFSKPHAKRPAQPADWQTFAHEGKFRIRLDPTGGRDGSPCLRVEGTGTGRGARAGALTTTPVLDGPRVLRVSAWTKGQGARQAIVLQFFHADNMREIAAMRSATIEKPSAEWHRVQEDLIVPRDMWGKKIRIRYLLYLYGTGWCAWDDAGLEAVDKPELKVRDLAASPLSIQPHPADGADAAQNPPDLRWRPEGFADTYDLQLCRKPDFTGPTLLAFEGLRYNCFNLGRPLARGVWYWRYRFDAMGGLKSEFSKPRRFRIGPSLPVFTLPAMDDIRKRLGKTHPRIYANPKSLPAFRARRLGEMKEWWATFQRRAEGRMKQKPAAEPVDCDLRKLPRPLDMNYFKFDTKLRRAAGQVAAGVWEPAFAYLVSGDKRYAEGAKKYLLHLAKWDPKGATSFGSNDQVFRSLLINSAMAYDWIHDTLTPDERRVVQEAVAARGRIMFRKYADGHRILNWPYDSHGQTNIGFMGLAALALAGDVPEADEWLDYTVKIYANSFPPWGGPEGGWSQGVTYWKYSCRMAAQYIDALRTATGVDLYQKPWYRNNGYFKLYNDPPWCAMSHFGDNSVSGPGKSDRDNMAHYAAIYRNPYYQWYADRIPAGRDTSVYGYFSYTDDLQGRPPFDLPQARYFGDVGWASMHSRLYAPDDVMLFAKSSWYGSFNHSHADQNSFVVYAYGEPLAIDSGYYPWYMSPHHKSWTIQTKAHNCILVDGEGQSIQDVTARGKCVGWLAGPGAALWAGEAAPAYKGKLDRFRRHIIFLPPDLSIIYDELVAPKPSTFQWTLHALDKMEIDKANQSVLIRKGDARLLVKHVAPDHLRQSQNDDFGVPPEPRRGKTDKQWHYVAETQGPAAQQEFFTVMRAFQRREKPQGSAKAFVRGKARGVVVESGDRRVVLSLSGKCVDAPAPLQFDRRVALVETVSKQLSRFALLNNTSFEVGHKKTLSSDQPLSVVAKRVAGGGRMHFRCTRAAKVSFAADSKPVLVQIDGNTVGAGAWSYDGKMAKFGLPAGEHDVAIFTRQPITVPANAALDLRVAGKTVGVGGAGRSANDTQVAWATFDAKPGVYRVRFADLGQAEVWLDRERLDKLEEVVLRDRSMILAETLLGAKLPRLEFEPLYAEGQGVLAPVVAESDPRLAAAIKVEAESYGRGIRGKPRIYSHRTFLSGGKGVSTPPVMGIGARWRVKVQKVGEYEMIWKVSTHEPFAERLVRVDGRPLCADAPVARFEYTTGFGATPAEWRHCVVADKTGQPIRVRLVAGEHTIEMISVAGLLNLDYFILAPSMAAGAE